MPSAKLLYNSYRHRQTCICLLRICTLAASKAAAKGESENDDVELSPEELGFVGHSEDAFAALKATDK